MINKCNGWACCVWLLAWTAGAANWVVDDQTYTNSESQVYTRNLAWAIAGANATPTEEHTITIISTNTMSASPTFAGTVQINSANSNVTMAIHFSKGGGASGISLAGATFDAGTATNSILGWCHITDDIYANGNPVTIGHCQFAPAIAAYGLGTNVTFENNEVNAGRIELRSGTVSGNTFLNGQLVAGNATISGNTFHSESGRVSIAIGAGNVGINSYTGPQPIRFTLGTNLYLTDIPAMELVINGNDNLVHNSRIVSNLVVSGRSNDLNGCDISDGKSTDASITITGNYNELRGNAIFNIGGIRFDGNEVVFSDNVVFSNAYGVAIQGDRGMIQRNRIGITPGGTVTPFTGNGLTIRGNDHRIGSDLPDLDNGNQLLGGSGIGIAAEGTWHVLRGNWVGVASNAGGYVLSGFDAGGIRVCNGASNTLDGNVIADSPSHGIVMTNSPWPQVMACRIGVVASNFFAGNGGHGLWMENCPRADIFANWIAGAGQCGMKLMDIPNSEIVGNRIGYIPEIAGGLLNGSHGIHLVNSSNVAIGLRHEGLGNVIGTNAGHGIYVEHNPWLTPDNDCNGLKICNNWVGHYESTMHANGGDGISLYGVSNAWVGGTNTFDGNNLGGNGGAGLGLARCQQITVYNNIIGVQFNPWGTTNMPNLDGIRGDNLHDCIIGGGGHNQLNNIAANYRDGIRVMYDTGESARNVFQGNFIGVDATGLTAIPNGGDGLKVEGNHTMVGGIMGPPTGTRAGNIISGNISNGLVIAGWSNIVAGNFIGVDDTGRSWLGNGINGIVAQCTYGQIGDPVLGGNVIGGNGNCGIWMAGAGMSNHVQNNYIGVGWGGTGNVHNSWSGIYLGEFTGGVMIGGDGAHEPNFIGNNTHYGVQLGNSGGRNHILNNWIGLAPTGMYFGVNHAGGILAEEETTANYIRHNRIDGAVGIKLIHTWYQWIEDNFLGFNPSATFRSSQMLQGIALENAGANQVGGNHGNDIGAAQTAGISISYTDEAEWSQWGYGNHVFSNRIGVATNLLGVVTNKGTGVKLYYARGSRIGDADHPNWIANCAHGIHSLLSLSNDISGNRIGMAPNGTVYGNAGHGVYIDMSAEDEVGITSGSTPNDAGNIIVGSQEDGVHVSFSHRIGIAGNTIGHDPLTQAPHPNQNGVYLGGSSNCLVGLHLVGSIGIFDANAIAGNREHGVYVLGGVSNWIGGNRIGVNSNCQAIIPNGADGIRLVESRHNEIGSGYGDCYEDGYNVISGNASNGITLWADDGAPSANVSGNFIGTDARSSQAIANGGYGIYIENSGHNRIGFGDTWCHNTIVNSGLDGIALQGPLAASNRIVSCHIGITSNGVAMGNGRHGIYAANALATVIGSSPALLGNTIGANSGCGIQVEGGLSLGTIIQGNRIGVAHDGITARANGLDGVLANGATNLMIGGPGALRNVIARNGRNGIQLIRCEDALIQGNRVGVDLEGVLRRGNQACGILISNSAVCVIGPDNVVGANGAEGIKLCGPSSDQNLIASNRVGISEQDLFDLSNGADGIHLRGGDRNRIISGNVVAKNYGHGVAIYTGARNTVLGNRIFGNVLQAIHVATNEPGVQPNERLLPPVITNAMSGSTQFQGAFSGKTNETYTLEVFYAWFTNQNGAQAQHYLAQTNIFSGPLGTVPVDITLDATAPLGSWLCMNASDTNGNSSELCHPVRVLDSAYLAWQNANSVTNGPDGDMDADTSDNLGEYLADTDPRNGQSVLSMSWASMNGADVWCSSTARLYTVYASSNLVAGNWNQVPGYVDATGTGSNLPVGVAALMSNDWFNAFSVKARLP